MQKLIVKLQPDVRSLRPPKNKYRKYIWVKIKSIYFEGGIMLVILFNIIQMAI